MNYFVATSLVALAIYLINKYFMSYWSRLGFKQLEPKFLVGDISDVFRQKTSIGEYFEKVYVQHKKHNKVVGLYFSYNTVLCVNDPMIIQDMLVRDFTSFHDRPFHVDEEKEPLSGHLFGLSGQKWRDLRVKLSPTFTSGKLKGMYPIIKDCGKVLEEFLDKNVKEGKDVFEFRDLMARYTTNIISSVAFGIENDCINDPDHIFRKMGSKIFEPSFKQAVSVIIGIFVPNLMKYIKFKLTDQCVEDFIFSIVNQTIEHREKNNITRNDFMQMLIQLKNQGFVSADSGDDKAAQKGDLKKLTLNSVAAQVFIFFLAGFETTSSTMFFFFWEMARNPEIQKKVQEELDRVSENGTKEVTHDMMYELKYLECCIDETLRKYPIVSTLMRESTKEYKISGTDLVLPKGSSIFFPLLGLQRDPEIYEDPLQFKPERFLNSPNGEGKSKGLFYLPFGDGPRNCIGMRMGKLTTKMGLALVLSKFNLEFSDKSMAYKEIDFMANQFNLTPKNEYKFKITPR